ncbi:acyltransferase [Photobacterium phosphoreum]|uniref:acyltransferase family protein n=1 Tax=Photobacterium phosphoreum TaxID=659 RepID=UPI000D185C9A|nr:acyltransferase family protein [Photobacterium phosphoreum]PSU84274.1 acyltransferase [Photobacterium phosphoreum]
MKFRTDINGLRAIAVMAVVLFHFNPSWVPGGFAGVDVFFVISGFLMTGLIFRGLENNNFSIINFYVARANRIIPALSVVCLALLVFGWFYLTPLDYRTLGKHVASSMGFVSNIIYWRESGYFDAASHSKWLLHTWSLSVEWQFYMIYPVVLVLLKKCMSLTNIKRLLVVGTVVGFIFSVYATYRWPNPAYFLFPTRAWEMMMGGLAFLYPLQNLKETSKKYLEWVGIALILASYAFISKDNLWPGYLALIPVLGAYLVIIANRSGSVITDNVVMQKVGLWSYSIYLWHWPVVVFGYYFEMQHWEWIGIPISVVLGFCSYKFVESIKFPALSSISFKPIATLKPLWMVVIVGIGAIFVYFTKPNSYLYPLPNSIIESMVRGYYPSFDKEGLDNQKNIMTELSKGREKLVALGDSHMYSILPVLDKIAQSKHINLNYAGYSGCPPLLDVSPIRNDQNIKNCNKLNKEAFDFILKNEVKNVFLAARWTYYTEGDYSGKGMQLLSLSSKDKRDKLNSILSFKKGVSETFKKYHDNNIKLYVMLQVPLQEHNPDYIMYHSILNGKLSREKLFNNSISNEKNRNFQYKTNEIIKNEAKKYKNITVIDPNEILCDDKHCAVGNDKYSYYFDDDHLSIKGAYLLEPLISPIL